MQTHWRNTLTGSIAVATAATVTGLVTHAEYGQQAQLVETLVAGLGGTAALKLLFDQKDGHGFKEGLGTSLGWLATFAGDAAIAGWEGGGQQSFWAWLGGAAASVALGFSWAEHRRHDRLERHHRTVSIRTMETNSKIALMREEMAGLKLLREQEKMMPSPAEQPPVFTRNIAGNIQHAIWELNAGKVIIPSAHVTENKRGWEARLTLPNGYGLKKLERDCDGIAQSLDLLEVPEAVSGASKGLAVLKYREPVELPSEVRWSPVSPGKWSDPVLLGIDEDGNTVTLDLNVHALVAGATGFGKSTLINTIILQLAEREHVKVTGIDMKPFSPEFTPLKPILNGLISDLETAHSVLDTIRDELYIRGEIMQKNGWKKWQPSAEKPIRYYFFDEYAELIRQDKERIKELKAAKGQAKMDQEASDFKTIQSKVESILAMSRAYGLYLVLATQQPSAALWGDDTGARGNCPIRICFTMSEATHDRFVLPAGWSTEILDGKRGRFVMKSPMHMTQDPYLAFIVDDDQLADEVFRISMKVPERPLSDSEDTMDTRVDWLTKSQGQSPRERVMSVLMAGPATKREIADKTNLDPVGSQLKHALNGLRKEEVIQVDPDNVWSLT